VINFRYHVVSLVAVFLALAVGVVLGAGPLQEPIGAGLAEQVSALRGDKDALRDELAAASSREAYSDETFMAAEDHLLADLLTDRRVAVISIGPDADERVQRVVVGIEKAGATVAAQVQLEDRWADASATDLATLADEVEAVFNSGSRESGDDRLTVALGLVCSLVAEADAGVSAGGCGGRETPEGGATEPPAEPGEQALTLWGAIEAADMVSGTLQATANAVVILSGPYVSDPKKLDPDAQTGSRSAGFLPLVEVLSATKVPHVVAGPDQTEFDLVTRVAAREDLTQGTSIVSSPYLGAETVTTLWALSAAMNGVFGRYGVGDDVARLPPYRPAPRLGAGAEGEGGTDPASPPPTEGGASPAALGGG
jgi:hypothetical protein